MKTLLRGILISSLFAIAAPAMAETVYVTRTTTCTATSCVRTTVVYTLGVLGQQIILSTETVTYANPAKQAQ